MGRVNLNIKFKKSQTAVEFIIILGVLLAILSIMISINFEVLGNFENQVAATKAKDAVTEIFKASKTVYEEGQGAKTKIFINIPRAVYGASVADNIVEVNLSIEGANISIYRKTYFDVVGTLPTEKGYYWMNVTSMGEYVLIEY